MNSFYVIANTSKETAVKTTEFIKQYLEEKGKICYVQDAAAGDGSSSFKYTDPAAVPDDVDCVLVLGGDGTLLQASRDLIETGLPLMGINMGTLGYLAEIEHQNIRPALDSLISDEYFFENRMMIHGDVAHHGKKLMEDIALNDIVITRRGRLRVVDFNIFVDDVYLCSYRADGIIISTPTGSTGYSLSAGGPIVSPDASLILLTAIAPHTLSSRTIVLPDHITLTVEVAGGSGGSDTGAEISFDGDTSMTLAFGGKVTVTKTEKHTQFVKIKHTSFVEIMREKLK